MKTLKTLACAVTVLSVVSVSDVNSKTVGSCFDEWRIPNCSDKDPSVGRTCVSMRQGYDACVAEVHAENDRRKRERAAKARDKQQRELAEAARKRQERADRNRESKRAEIEAVEKVNRSARELQKLNGPRATGSQSTSGTIQPAKPRDDSERRGF